MGADPCEVGVRDHVPAGASVGLDQSVLGVLRERGGHVAQVVAVASVDELFGESGCHAGRTSFDLEARAHRGASRVMLFINRSNYTTH